MIINKFIISTLEQKNEIEYETLNPISNALRISLEAFQNFNEEEAVNFISNKFNNNDSIIGFVIIITIQLKNYSIARRKNFFFVLAYVEGEG